MPLVLTRIDDRLIHGQVVVGWGSYIKPDRIILCSDHIATCSWQREIFVAAGALAMYAVDISIWTEDETIAYFANSHFKKEKIILLVETPEELCNLIKKHAPIQVVNVGGMHFKPGKKQIAPYIFVNEKDIDFFKILINNNIILEGQDVPNSRKLNIAKLLEIID